MSSYTRPAFSSIWSLAVLNPTIRHTIAVRGIYAKAMDAGGRQPEVGDAKRTRKMRKIEDMPFQTYQLALGVIRKDREEKLAKIKEKHEKIAKLIKYKGLEPDSTAVKSMIRYLEDLKIKADINNPRVKYNFDTGVIGMNKPVYRYLLEKIWRSMRRRILMQRLTQMNVIPDVLPGVNPIVDVQVRFKGKGTKPGEFVTSEDSERRPTFKIIPFRQGQTLCTVVVVDPDVPDVENDCFRYRLHWIVSNITISHMQVQAIGRGAKPSNEIIPYLPPHVQKGSPYHRYSMFVFAQRDNKRIDPKPLVGNIDRDTFNLRAFQGIHGLRTIGAFMWRGLWDEGTKKIMQKYNLPGWDVMYTRIKDT